MIKAPLLLSRPLALAGMLLATLTLAPADAAPSKRRAAASAADLSADFRAMAQQRPWDCVPAAAGAAGAPWQQDTASCAWQNRLRRHSWRWSEDAAPACISTQARWWSWAQSALPPGAPRSVWDTRWSAQTVQFSVGEERRLLVLQRDGGGWQATEWRWNPNPRPATRTWQEGRWKALLASAARYRQAAPAAAAPDAARLQPAFQRVLGARAGELNAQGLAMDTEGVCVRAGNPLPGVSRLPLSYSPNDSRLEQRTAMHLQLSRQFPNVKWLTPFKLLALPPRLPSGAKFLATWVDGGQVYSQLWMPARTDAPTVRIRASAPLPLGQDAGSAAAVKVKQVLERELEAIAVQWAVAYE